MLKKSDNLPKPRIRAACLICLALLVQGADGQVSIDGPTCVVPGTVYQYTIQGPWTPTDSMHVCVTGGSIQDTSATGSCTAGSAPLGSVMIIWDDAATNGTISITTSEGNASIQALVTSALQPGQIDSSLKSQIIDSGAVPNTVSCSVGTGGSCSPAYSYQWQQSADMVSWSDISGATGQNLNFSAPLQQSTFYRRKLSEQVSGTIDYSDAASVAVMVQ